MHTEKLCFFLEMYEPSHVVSLTALEILVPPNFQIKLLDISKPQWTQGTVHMVL